MNDFSFRYSRQTRLSEWGIEAQQRLARSRVLVVGAGGLGSPVCLYLASAGVGTLGIVDDDRVDASNLQRQVLFAEADAGEGKAEAASRRVRALNSQVRTRVHAERFRSENALNIAADYDLLIDGSDNFSTKFLLNGVSLKLGLPLVHGAVNGFDGQVTVFEGRSDEGAGPCYRCLTPAPPRIRVKNCAETGVIGALPGVIGSMQAMLALQWIGSGGDASHPLYPGAGILQLLQTRGEWSSRTIRIRRRRDCPDCSHSPESLVLSDQAEGCERVPSVSPEEFRMRQARSLVIDVREAEELAEGIIPESLHWPLSRLENGEFPGTVDRDPAAVLVYCRSGYRSEIAARLLLQAGFSKVASLSGGMDALGSTAALAPSPF